MLHSLELITRCVECRYGHRFCHRCISVWTRKHHHDTTDEDDDDDDDDDDFGVIAKPDIVSV